MADSVKLPLLGDVPKGGVFAGTLAAVGVGGYMLWKHDKAKKAAAAAAAAGPPTVPPGGAPGASGYGYGYGYGASGYGYGAPEPAYGYGYGAEGYGFGAISGGGGYPSYYGYGTGTTVTATTNAQWAQNATAQLTNQGYTSTAVLTALGLYLAGKSVVQGSSNDTTISAAIALEGYPPQPGSTGFPPAVNYGGTSGQGGGTTGGFQAYAPGGKSLSQLASLYPGVTAQELEKMNPGVYQKYGSRALPKGTGYYVPKEPTGS